MAALIVLKSSQLAIMVEIKMVLSLGSFYGLKTEAGLVHLELFPNLTIKCTSHYLLYSLQVSVAVPVVTLVMVMLPSGSEVY